MHIHTYKYTMESKGSHKWFLLARRDIRMCRFDLWLSVMSKLYAVMLDQERPAGTPHHVNCVSRTASV